MVQNFTNLVSQMNRIQQSTFKSINIAFQASLDIQPLYMRLERHQKRLEKLEAEKDDMEENQIPKWLLKIFSGKFTNEQISETINDREQKLGYPRNVVDETKNQIQKFFNFSTELGNGREAAGVAIYVRNDIKVIRDFESSHQLLRGCVKGRK